PRPRHRCRDPSGQDPPSSVCYCYRLLLGSWPPNALRRSQRYRERCALTRILAGRWPYPREATTVLLHTTTTPNHWSIAGGERQRQRRNSVSEVDTVPCARELYRIKDRFSAAAVQAPNSATPDIRPANLALSLPTKAQLCEGPSSSCYWTLS